MAITFYEENYFERLNCMQTLSLGIFQRSLCLSHCKTSHEIPYSNVEECKHPINNNLVSRFESKKIVTFFQITMPNYIYFLFHLEPFCKQ